MNWSMVWWILRAEYFSERARRHAPVVYKNNHTVGCLIETLSQRAINWVNIRLPDRNARLVIRV